MNKKRPGEPKSFFSACEEHDERQTMEAEAKAEIILAAEHLIFEYVRVPTDEARYRHSKNRLYHAVRELQLLRSDEDRGEPLPPRDDLGSPTLTALENVRMLAVRMRKSDPENADQLLRFCAAAGVVGNVLRDDA